MKLKLLMVGLIFLLSLSVVNASCPTTWLSSPQECWNLNLQACQDRRCCSTVEECGVCGCEETACTSTAQCCQYPSCGLAWGESLNCINSKCTVTGGEITTTTTTVPCISDWGRWENSPNECCHMGCQDKRCVPAVSWCGTCGCEGTNCLLDSECCQQPECGLAEHEYLSCDSLKCKEHSNFESCEDFEGTSGTCMQNQVGTCRDDTYYCDIFNDGTPERITCWKSRPNICGGGGVISACEYYGWKKCSIEERWECKFGWFTGGKLYTQCTGTNPEPEWPDSNQYKADYCWKPIDKCVEKHECFERCQCEWWDVSCSVDCGVCKFTWGVKTSLIWIAVIGGILLILFAFMSGIGKGIGGRW